MKNKKLVYKNHIQEKYLDKNLKKKYLKSFPQILKAIYFGLDERKDVAHSLSKRFRFNFKTKDISHFKKYNTVVVIGMGGSILGSEAIYDFLNYKIKKKFIFLNNINGKNITEIKKNTNLKKVLFILISKSGKTIETLTNIIALKIIKKNSKNVILISERSNNPFYVLAKKMKLFHVEHKHYIGGRFSVLSEVGMLPAYFMGLNIREIRKNLTKNFKQNKKIFLKDSTIKLANLFQAKKFKNLVFFNYHPELNKFLCWCQQLIAESLGKKGKGFFPTISTGPKDHHSLLQLYLDGPKDKIFYIFSNSYNDKKKLNTKFLDKSYKFLNKKNLNQIKIAQKNAFIKALKKKEIPYREFIVDSSEKNLGELFAYFMLETIIVGKLVNINPFDQPAVEQVKIDTKKILN